ncbi:hypothetical protein Tco_0430854 [Tanacetum coccineum]
MTTLASSPNYNMFLLQQIQQLRHNKSWIFLWFLCTIIFPARYFIRSSTILLLPSTFLKLNRHTSTKNFNLSKKSNTPTNVNAEENNDNQAEDAQFQQDEFINPFYTPDSKSGKYVDKTLLAERNQGGGSLLHNSRWVRQSDHPEKVYRLRKDIYGLKQAQRWDSGFKLTTFLDVDHAGCIDTGKSTSGGIQFLGDKLSSWCQEEGVHCYVSSRGLMPLLSLAVRRKVFNLDVFQFRYNIHTVKRSSQNWSLIPAESDSLPHAHAQTTKTYYKHQDSRIKKAQELKTKTFANSDIKDNSSETKLRGRLLESFQEDAKYEHVGQDTRSQGGKDDQD